MNPTLNQLACQNFGALCTLAKFLESRGYWTANRAIELDVASAVHQLFEALAWADGNLHARECWLIDALLEGEASFHAELRECFATGSSQATLPGCIAAAALHDSIHHTSLADIFLNHLENLGRLIVMADATITPEELSTFHAHFAKLRHAIAPSECHASSV